MMKNVMLIHGFIISMGLLFFATACEHNRIDTDPQNEYRVHLVANAETFAKVESKRTKGKGDTTSDPFEIKSVERTDDILKVEVSYSGGCKEHTFDVLWGGQILLTEPCQINIVLMHDAKNDACEAYLTKTLEIDLNKLVGDNDAKDACNYNVFSVFNESDSPDGVASSEI